MAGSAVLNASSAAEIKAGKLSAGTITANASSAASIKCSGRNVQKSESTLGSVKIVKEGRSKPSFTIFSAGNIGNVMQNTVPTPGSDDLTNMRPP